MTTSDYQSRLGLSYAPSSYQTDIFDHVENGKGNLVVEAVAGSGKTTTIVCAAKLLRVPGLFVAFNKSIATELSGRLAGTKMTAKTAHSVGYGAIRFANHGVNIRVDQYKYNDMLQSMENEIEVNGTCVGRKVSKTELTALRGEGRKARLGFASKVFDLARLNLLDFDSDAFSDDLWDLVNHHGLDVPAGLNGLVEAIMVHLAAKGRENIAEVDFCDMVWLPVVNGYKPKSFQRVFVDECQDLSACILALLRKCVTTRGRMVFVGDRRQAIYGFAGADAKSFENIISATKAAVLPLSVCYRCPTKVVDLAREYCPQIEAREGAPEGSIESIDYLNLTDVAAEGDMVLSRTNAPLVEACFAFIAADKKATIRGRDIGQGLIKAARQAAKAVKGDMERFTEGLDAWEQKEATAIRKRGGRAASIEARLTALSDKRACLGIVYARSGATTLDGLVSAIEGLFSEDRRGVVLSSIHKAKGLENPRVFIMGSPMLDFPDMQEWQREQERNLAYVAFTRAEETLVLVVMPPRG